MNDVRDGAGGTRIGGKIVPHPGGQCRDPGAMLAVNASTSPFWGWRGPMIIDLDSWEMGYADGLNGHPSRPQADLDPFSYSSGYVQGRTQDSHHPQSSRRQATQSRGAGSRLLIFFSELRSTFF